MKKCSKCDVEKEISEFVKDKYRLDGHKSRCKKCMASVYKKSYAKRKDKILQQRKNTCEENKNKKINSDYVKICKDCKKSLNASSFWRDNHKYDGLRPSCKDCINKHRKNNKQKILASQRKCWKKRVSNDMVFKLKNTISINVRQCLNKKGKSKRGKTFEHLPYTPEELKKHIESQFESWMTWDNWGVYKTDEWGDNDQSTWKWNLDHIIPHSRFNYDSVEHPDFKKCWALENLRPYSAKQNLIDGARTFH